MIGKRMRHIGRYHEIAVALLRHGFGMIVDELGFSSFLSLPPRWRAEQGKKEGKTVAERLRLVLEELGPTFIKLGQIASTRPDLLPSPIIRELEKLQDQVPPFPFSEVRQIVETELGDSLEKLFRSFAKMPLAAASLGQVHQAVLPSGQAVVVKVQRPRIAVQMETDLDILQDLAVLAERRLEWAASYRLSEIVDELTKSLRQELDYTVEARHAETFAHLFADDPSLYVPGVFWEYTTKKVLTMEYIDGVKLGEIERLKESGYSLQALAERLAASMLKQMFEHGFFHGDPHPGNVFVLPGGVLAFIDFGLMGRLRPNVKHHLSTLVIALMRQNTDGVLNAIYGLGLVPDEVDEGTLRDDIDELREKYYRVPLSDISLGEAVEDLLSVAFRHGIRIPSDLTLLGKALLTVEGVVEMLDPQFRIIDVAEPFGRKLLKERLRPDRVVETAWKRIFDYGEWLLRLPDSVKEWTKMMRHGKLRLEITAPDLETLLRKLDQMANRLSFSIVLLSLSIVLAGLMIASSLGRPSTLLWNIPAVEIGLGAAAFLFGWLLYSIFRSGRF
ncbi:AarF/ABC1/UbiB kinase family protein [Geobacillus sp. C56-T2]|uniref:ABC1 kinase family protein n=1 Tax=Geobacillus sp. C56-T2 TaxID=600773 RepID=UPI0011A33AD7|nr:AarF/ABC1/UbiB kinase family protein [Geobacillus sp. C56-T2]NNV05942.1 AarF/ABC1/UbiB kinase family protein [Geobacillus sp. MMMUD3]TWG30577.1 2-octaprenylphenol hydroxylase [Geobacillus sp. C56-T2]